MEHVHAVLLDDSFARTLHPEGPVCLVQPPGQEHVFHGLPAKHAVGLFDGFPGQIDFILFEARPRESGVLDGFSVLVEVRPRFGLTSKPVEFLQAQALVFLVLPILLFPLCLVLQQR
ncbi:MAG: hypothetical protein LBR95_06995 [Azoarcus sp.]|nr:hypothetical protein [Azoarcus sp.]